MQEERSETMGVGQEVSYARKASGSTLQVAEYLKEKLNEQGVQEEEGEEQLDEQIFNTLSSGVYQMSRRGDQQDQEEQKQREYYSQQVKLRQEVVVEKVDNLSGEGESGIGRRDVEVRENEQRLEMSSGQTKQKILSPSLQQQPTHSQNQEMEFYYPSLMEESLIQPKEIEHKGQSVVYTQIQEEDEENVQKTQKVEIQAKKQDNNIQNQDIKTIKTAQIDKRPIVQVDQDLLDIGNQSQKDVYSDEEVINQQSFRQSKVTVNENQAQLKILGYEKQYFFKMQTQIYQIQYSFNKKSYIFCRKFADFVILDKLIRIQYPGFILYPLPENTLEFFKKIKLSVGSQLQKVTLIEKRLLQLEKYLNFLRSHKQIGTSQIYEVFILQSNQRFTREMNQLQQLLQKQESRITSSSIKENYKNIKNLVRSSLSYFSSYISNPINQEESALMTELKRKADGLLNIYEDLNIQLEKSKLIAGDLNVKIQKLIQIYQYNIRLKPMESSIDSVLRLSSKMTSSRTSYEQHKNWIEDHILVQISYYVTVFQQIEEQLKYRSGLLGRVHLLEEGQTSLGGEILLRVEQFDGRFINDWIQLKKTFEEDYAKMIQDFTKQWVSHCRQMTKIWK